MKRVQYMIVCNGAQTEIKMMALGFMEFAVYKVARENGMSAKLYVIRNGKIDDLLLEANEKGQVRYYSYNKPFEWIDTFKEA